MRIPSSPAALLQTLAGLGQTPKVESFAARLADLDRPAAPPASKAVAAAPPAPGPSPKPRGSLVDLVV